MMSTGAEGFFLGGDPLVGLSARLPAVPVRAKISHPPAAPEFAADSELETRNEISAISMTTGLDDATFEQMVNAHYEALYRFAFSLSQTEADARDLVQDTFVQFARKGDQIKSPGKAKSWLFTTLYRAFIDGRRRELRHPKVDLGAVELDLPVTEPDVGIQTDAQTVQDALMQLDEVFRAPLILFYLEEHSYLEIAEILNVPPGTVMSRISRGRSMLRRLFEERELVSAGRGLEQKGVST